MQKEVHHTWAYARDNQLFSLSEKELLSENEKKVALGVQVCFEGEWGSDGRREFRDPVLQRERNIKWHVEKSDFFMDLSQPFTAQSCCNLYGTLNKRPYRPCISWLQGSFRRQLSRLLFAAPQPHEMRDSPPALQWKLPRATVRARRYVSQSVYRGAPAVGNTADSSRRLGQGRGQPQPPP